MKAAPPPRPTSIGKRQMLPSPTAEPAEAKTTPNWLAKLPLEEFIVLSSFFDFYVLKPQSGLWLEAKAKLATKIQHFL